MLDDRKLSVLRAIVEDFVRTHEPVGSKALVERHSLGVSPATIRNDMAALEEEGFIAQPHTSAGRIPTDKGYRLFVDRLSQVKPLSPAERRAIEKFLSGAVDLDDVMRRSVRLLAQITRQVALVQYPSLTSSALRHVEVVSLSEHRLLLVLIADSGRIEQRIVEVPTALSEDDLARLRTLVNESVDGEPLASLSERVTDLPERFDEAARPAVSIVLAALLETVVERHEERIVMGGTANLARYVDGFDSLEPVLEALEEQMVLMRLLGAAGADSVSVTIGHENLVASMSSTSVISTGYGPNQGTVARIGVVGPTHMDYPSTMASVRAVARYLGQLLRNE
ncbi:MAG: heat-inducible transcriptional repressor HrcA [Actinomycetota bacterium]|nr:heat-inducible transcriptional repressor HrcA [Actinomycetota bacterium]